MHFGFVLELSNVDLLNIDLLDTRLDLLDTDIPSKYFACLHNVFKTSSRHVFKTSSRHVFKTSSRRLGRRKIVTLKTSSRPTNVCWELCNQSMAFKMIFKNFSDILMVQELLYFLEFRLQLLFVLLI